MNLKLTVALLASRLLTSILAYPTIHEARHFTRAADIEASYDYIVVGGGTSGLTVADRLTEDGKCKVNDSSCCTRNNQ